MAFEDTFTRADNAATLGSPWTVHAGKFGIASNRGLFTDPVFGPGQPGFPTDLNLVGNLVAVTVDVGSADMAVEWDAEQAGPPIYRAFRVHDETSMLAIVGSTLNPDTIALYEINPAGNTAIRSASVSGWQAKRVRVEAVGTSITVYVDGTTAITGTSSYNVTKTRAGIGGNAYGWQPTSLIPFSDSFTRADASTLSAPWTVTGGTWGIESNRGRYISGGSGEIAATVDLGTPNQTVEWEWSALHDTYTYNAFRFADINNYWEIQGDGTGKLSLYRKLSGAWNAGWHATGVTWGPGHVLRAESDDSTIRVYVDGTKHIEVATAVPHGWRAGLAGTAHANLAITRWTRFAATSSPSGLAFTGAPFTGPTLPQPHFDKTRFTRFWCDRWPLGGFRNLGLTRGARSVT